VRVRVISHTPDPVKVMAEAAGVCYDSQPSEKIVRHCLDSGHLSIAEFADFHFEIAGVTRALTHQLVRKRMASYAQRSQRYVDEQGFGYTTPKTIWMNKEAEELYDGLMENITNTYATLLALGVPKEDARYVLPNAAHTIIHAKFNFRSLMDFYNQRSCERSQWEIRALARLLKVEVANISPFLANYLVTNCEISGKCPEGKKSCGRYPTNK